MKRKLFALVLACAMVLSLAACGKKDEPSTSGSASSGFVTVNSLAVKTAEITTAGGRVNIGFAETEAAKIRTVGGNVALMLGQGGAEVLYEHSSGKLKTKRAYEQKGDLVVFGGGACKLIVETADGNLEIQ